MVLNEQIKQIAMRLKGLREVLDLSVGDVSGQTGISIKEIEQFESGEFDIPMSFICDVARAYKIEPAAIISGDEPKMQSYFLTRKGKGVSMERTKAYKYMALAAGFKNAVCEPFEVTIEPNDNPITLNSHTGQEFQLVLEGKILIQIDEKQLILQEGDSLYFDSLKKHGMKALDGKTARFLAVILK